MSVSSPIDAASVRLNAFPIFFTTDNRVVVIVGAGGKFAEARLMAQRSACLRFNMKESAA